MTTFHQQTEKSHMEQEERSRRAFRLLLILGSIVAAASTLALIRALLVNGTLSFPIAGIITGLVVLAGAYIARRGRTIEAALLVSILLFAFDLYLISRYDGIGFLLTLSLAAILSVTIGQMLPPERITRGVMIVIGVSVAIIILDLYWPGSRKEFSASNLYVTYISVAIILGIAIVMAARQFPAYSLQTKLVLTSVTLVVLTVLLTTVTVSIFTRRELTNQIERKFQTVGQSQATAIGELLEQQASILQALSLDSTLRGLVHVQNINYSGDTEAIRDEILQVDTQWNTLPDNDPVVSSILNNSATRTLQTFRRNFPDYANVLVTDQYGALAGSAYRPFDYYQGDEEWWQAAYNDGQGDTYVGEPAFDPEVEAVVLPIAVPIYTADTNSVLGVLYVTYSLNEILRLLEITDELGDKSEADLLFGDDTLRYAVAPGEDMSSYSHAESIDPAVLAKLQQEPGRILVTEVEDIPSIASLQSLITDSPLLDELDWSILIHQDRAAAFAAITGQRRISVILGLIAVIIGTALATYSARRITGPINRLTETAVSISAGDLNRRAPVETQDEIGTLAITFNDMTAQLRDFISTLEDRVASRTRALATSAEVSRYLSTIVEVDHLVAEVVNQMRDAFGYYYAQIYLYDEARQELVMAGGTGEAGQAMLAAGHTLQPGQGLVGQAAASNQVILIDDVTKEAAWLPNELLPETRSEIAVPIATGDKVLGVLDVQHNVVAGFNNESADLIQSIAHQVAIAIQNARTFEQLQQQEKSLLNALEESGEQARRLALLSEMGALLNAAKDLDEVYEIAAPRIQEIIYGERIIVSLLDPAGETFQATVLTDQTGVVTTGMKMPLSGTVVGAAVREKRLLNLPHDISFEEFADARRLYASGIQSAVIVPLIVGDKLLGTLNIASQQPEAFQEIDTQFAQQIANLLAVTIESRRLGAQARLLASVVEDHPDFIGTGSLAGEMLYINPAGLQMLGLPQDYDVTQMNLTDFYSPEDARRLIQEGIPAALAGGSWSYEAVVLTADGRQITVEETVGINRDATGHPVSFNMTLHDITERQEAEKAIRESEARLSALVEYAPETIMVLDVTTGNFVEVNRNAEELFGLDRETLLQMGPVQLSPPTQPNGKNSMEAALEKIQEAVAGGTPVFEWVFQTADERLITCEVRLVKWPGYDHFIQGSIVDITEQQKAQAAVAKLAADLQIVAEVSRIATTILDTRQLLQEVVDLTKERFDLYHVHIYLMSEDKQHLKLAAGAGELGRMMVADGYQIPVAEKESVVARAARSRQGVVVNDVRQEAGFLANPLLPGARSELAAPLIVGDDVLGVLDVQSDETGYFSETDVNIQTTLALQIAAALQNAIQYQKAQEALAELTRLQQIMVREGWEAYLQEDRVTGYVYDLQQVQPLAPSHDTAVPDVTDAVLAPLTVRGAAIGTLGILDPSGKPVPPEKQYLLQSISQQVAEALERARLFEETETARRHLDQRAEELAVLNQVAEAAARQLDVNNLFRAIHRQVQRVVAVDTFFAAVYNQEQNWFDFVYFYDHGRQTQVKPLPADPFYETVQVYQSGQPAVTNHTEETFAEARQNMGKKLLDKGKVPTNMVFVPLRAGAEIIGVISVQNYQYYWYTDSDVTLLEGIANHTAVALQNIRLLTEAQSRAQRERTLRDITARVSAAVDAESVLRVAAEEIGRVLNLETCVYLADPDAPENGTPQNGS